MTDSVNKPVFARPRRRARLKEEGASVTVTLTKQEEAMLQELCRVRRPGRTAYSTNEFFQLLLIRNWQQWQEQKAQLGKCQACGKLKAEEVAAANGRAKPLTAG
ncbi:hypothetical protein [Escherichia coli]|uniref:hypothetical protein n=1 Tax=Escherichia coli TaxID=562 RepID=UPI00201CB41E|nr:hypothetical protein [Escherichia coli]